MPQELTIQEAALAVVRRLREQGHQALWAGGCVRDMLLGCAPVDIDVATDATPERIVQLFRGTRKVGMQFGVVLVRQGRHWIETATFRTDVDYQDGRRPEHVVFTTAEHDAERRDFTINGLFYDPVEQRVIDYVGGRQDLTARIVRAIGEPDRRFAEDHLRLMRAVRFATRFGFAIEPVTTEAIRRQAERIKRISPERVREELEKMLSHVSRSQAVEQLAGLGLLQHLWPGPDWPRERLTAAVRRLAALPPDTDFPLAMAALLHDVPARELEEVGRALRCSNQQIDELVWLVGSEPALHRAAAMSLAEFKRLLAHSRFGDLLELHRAVLASRALPLTTYERAVAWRESIPPEEITPPPLVTGDDLIAMGLQPGPRFGQILDVLYDAQLNRELITREAALERARTAAAQGQ